MSSLPSLSQSISPAPPLMDSTMYFLSGEEMCGTVNPAFWAMSSNCGTGCGLGSCVFDNGELAGALAGADWAGSIAESRNTVHRENAHTENVHTESEARIGRRSIIQGWFRARLRVTASQTIESADASGTKQNAPDSVLSLGTSVDQPSPKCCSRTRLP